MHATVPRRCFLNQLLMLGAAASAAPTMALTHPFTIGRRKEVMLDQLNLSDFASLVGTDFQLSGSNGNVIGLRLVEATPVAHGGQRPNHLAQRVPFSIVFIAPRDASLTQQIYRLKHDAMGEFDVFLVPISLGAEALKCEAIFN